AARGHQVHRRPVGGEARAEGTHPAVVLVGLLTTGAGPPGNQLVGVGRAGVVADVLAREARPGRRTDDLAWLRLDVAKADLLVLAMQRQVGMFPAGAPGQGLPRLDRHMAVGLGGEHQHGLARIDVAHDAWHPLADAGLGRDAVQVPEVLDLVLGVPGDALATIAEATHQGAQRGELAIDVRIVALDERHLRRGPARHQLDLPLLPFADIAGLGQLAGRVVHQRREYQVLLASQVADTDLAERAREALVDLPVAARFPDRIDRRRQR